MRPPLPAAAQPVDILSVPYRHLALPDGSDLYLTPHGVPFWEFLLPECWYEKQWFSASRTKLQGTSLVYRVATKPVRGEQKDLVVKWCRVGETVPVDTFTLQKFIEAEFNTPYEEFSLLSEMRAHAGHVLTQKPLAIFVPAKRFQLWQTGRKRSKIEQKKAKFRDVELDISRQYIMIYEWIKGAAVTEPPAREAAARAGLPRIAIGNFSWDWIYEPYIEADPRWQAAVDAFRTDYAAADVLLQYPLSPDMSATFPRRIGIPLPARPGRPRRAELAARTGADPARRWILLSFTTLDWTPDALARVAAIADTEFFTVRPLEWQGIPNIHAVDRGEFPFSDIVATVDAVLSKPGFGILADCAANGKPLIYADRENFAEYPVLERAIKTRFLHVHIPAADLYAGNLAPSLDALASAPPPPSRLPLGGDTAAAREILRRARG